MAPNALWAFYLLLLALLHIYLFCILMPTAFYYFMLFLIFLF